eukprot:scaffold21642_cov63-Phaeocystis_antarctica.AAC.3
MSPSVSVGWRRFRRRRAPRIRASSRPLASSLTARRPSGATGKAGCATAWSTNVVLWLVCAPCGICGLVLHFNFLVRLWFGIDALRLMAIAT